MKSKGEKANLDNSDNLEKYTITDARRLWMVWWNRNQPDLLNLKAKHHTEGQRAFQHLLTEARNQLRTDEAVARLANFLHNDDVGETLNEHEESCRIPDCNERDLYAEYAHAAINALLGDA